MNRDPAGYPWPELLATALLGTTRQGSGAGAEALLDAAAGHALRRRAGVALVPIAPPPEPAPVDDVLAVGPAAAARADVLLALDHAGRHATPLRDLAGRRELLAEWLAAAAGAGRRLPPELVPALLDAGRRHPQLRPWVVPVGGPLAGWLAGQRTDWSYAAESAEPAAEPAPAAELAQQAVAALRAGDGPPAAAPAALARCPRPWPPAVADAVLATLTDRLGHPRSRWQATWLCELAALGLPAGDAPRVAALVQRLGGPERPGGRGLAAAEQLLATVQFRHEMLEELASDR